MSDGKAAGYFSSFVNFVGNKEDHDDEATQSSGDMPLKQDQTDKDSVPVSRPNTAKRGRLRGPKCVRKRLAKNNSDASSGSAPASENEKESEDDEPPVVARRIRTTRAAKQKATRKGKNKKAAKDSDDDASDSSDYIAEVHRDDDDDDDADSVDKRNSDYDSDEDPAWRPKKRKYSSTKKRAATSESDDDELPRRRGRPPTRGRGRAVQGRGRGTGSKQIGNKESSNSMDEDRLPGTVRSAKSSESSVAGSLVTKIAPEITKIPEIQRTPPSITSAPRPVGRPPTIAVIGSQNTVMPVPMTDNYIPDLNPPHNCQKGDFILDRRDMSNYTTFPIWRIDSQRLLQKFEAFEKDGRLLHRALCTYSSWPVHAQHNYTAVAVRYISCTRGKEIVEVQQKYRPRPLGVQGAELDALRETFTVYTQILLSQALEPTFIGALNDEPDEYYTVPSEKVDSVVADRIKYVQKLCPWNSDFLNDLKKFHAFTLIDCPDGTSWSKATNSHSEAAKKCVRFHGHVYNPETLETIEEVPENDGPEYPLTASESIVVTVLHSLYHLKFKLCLICQARVDELKESKRDVDDHSVLDTCLRDQAWMQQLFTRLTTLLENADRISGR